VVALPPTIPGSRAHDDPEDFARYSASAQSPPRAEQSPSTAQTARFSLPIHGAIDSLCNNLKGGPQALTVGVLGTVKKAGDLVKPGVSHRR